MSGIDYSKFLRRVRHRTWNGEYKPMSINLTREEWQHLQQARDGVIPTEH